MQIYADGSKVDEKIAAAAMLSVAPNTEIAPCRLRDHCSIYTAELQAILFALKQVYQSKEKKFMIFSDSLSALQALKNFKIDHPLLLLIQIQELLHKINANKKETIFMWVPGHTGIDGNRQLIELQKRLSTLNRWLVSYPSPTSNLPNMSVRLGKGNG